jgi:hypothetical protein
MSPVRLGDVVRDPSCGQINQHDQGTTLDLRTTNPQSCLPATRPAPREALDRARGLYLNNPLPGNPLHPDPQQITSPHLP